MKLDLAGMKKRWQVRSVLAITVESHRVAVDLVRSEAGENQTARSLMLPFGAEAVLAEPEKVGQELAAQLLATGIRERRAVVCIPAGWALSATTEVPALGGEDLRGYLELRAEREFPVAASELRLAHCTYLLPDGQERATLAGVPNRRLEAVERVLAAAGLRAVSISLGLDACLPASDATAALHFIANGNHVDAIIAGGGGIAAMRSLDAPPGPDATTFDAGEFSREVRITLGRLPDALRQQVREARFGGTPAAAENLCIEVRQQLRRMGIDSRLQSPVPKPIAVGVEAAARHLRRAPVTFEFVPPQVNRWQTTFHRFDSRNRRWAIGAVAAFILLPILIFFIRSQIESSLTAEWNGMKRNVTELESLGLRIRQFRPWFETVPQTLQVLEGAAASFPEQGDVWAKSIQVGEGYKVTCSGFARSQAALLALLDRMRTRPDVTGLQVQSVRGENPLQFSITYKWEPRDVR